MGDGTRLDTLYFPRLDRGWNPTAALRSMAPEGQGPLFLNMVNLRPHDGGLMLRPRVYDPQQVWDETLGAHGLNWGPTINNNTPFWGGPPTYEAANGQTPVKIFSDFALTKSLFGAYDSVSGRHLLIVVTSREIWINSLIDGVWYNVTPTYAWGNVTYVNATKTVSISTVGAWTNDPTGDKIQIKSSNAADTTQKVRIKGTDQTTGALVNELMTLNGTTLVDSAYSNWGKLCNVTITPALAGNLTVQKKTGGLPITVVNSPSTYAYNPATPLWKQRHVGVGSQIQFNGAGSWYSVQSVTDTTLVLSTAVGSDIAVAQPYIIRRTFGGREYSHVTNLLYASLYNGDLYIAGSYLGGSYYDITSAPVACGPAIIRVKNVYGSVFTTEYLAAPVDFTGRMEDYSLIPNIPLIHGMQVLQDGRVVILCNEQDSTKSAPSVARVRWSSINDGSISGSAQARWTQATGGGFVDLVPGGQATALGYLQGRLTVHYPESIVTGTPTGQTTTYPISWADAAAEIGCIAPRTIVPYKGGELYLGSDYQLRYFNGSTSTVIDSPLKWILKDYEKSHLYASAHGSYDSFRDEYTLWFAYTTSPTSALAATGLTPNPIVNQGLAISTGTYKSFSVTVGINSGLCYYDDYGVEITAIDTSMAGGQGDTTDGNGRNSAVLGARRRGVLVGIPTTTTSWNSLAYHLTEEGHRIPYPANYTETAASAYAETDFQDMGLPGVEKTISHVIVWATADVTDTAQTLNLTVTCTNEVGSTVTATGAFSVVSGQEQPVMFSFAPLSGEAWKFKLSGLPDPGLRLTRMLVRYQTTGEMEAARDLTP